MKLKIGHTTQFFARDFKKLPNLQNFTKSGHKLQQKKVYGIGPRIRQGVEEGV